MRTTLLCMLAVLTAFCTTVVSQTNPGPYDLSTGSYSFSQWDATNSAATFPASMRFHTYSTTSSITTVEPLMLSNEMNADWDLAYNLTSGARFLGSGVDGISFLNTSSSAYTPTRFLGAAVVALNTTNRVNIRVDWTGGTVATQPRQYAIVLQYRVGSSNPWLTAIQNTIDTVQYKTNTTSGHSQAMPTFTLPAACENQPLVQLRWRYYQFSTAASGNRPQLRLDGILVQSDASTGVPTKLSFSAVTPATPSVLTPFSVTVQSLNAADQIKNVTQNTDITLSVYSGTGNLTGTLTGTILSGTNTLVMSGLSYSIAQTGVQLQVVRASGDLLSSAVSQPFTVLPRAAQLAMSTLQANAYVGVALSSFAVTAQRSDLSTDLNYPGPITLAKQSGPGNITGTLVLNPVSGVVNFSGITFDAPGTYALSASGPNVSSATSTSIVVVGQPSITELVMPQYMAARSISLPSWALIRLDNLLPNTAYRFYTAAAEINNLAGFAAGTNLHYNAGAGTFDYVPASFSDFGTPGRYSQFTTGSGETSKTMSMNMVPSSNTRFTAGNAMYWYISLRDTTRSIETRFITTGTTKTLALSTAAGDGSGISDTASTCDPKTVICLYDNVTGTGNPLSTALVQDDGTLVAGAPAFYAAIELMRTAWATIIPNTLAAGVRRVEQRSLSTGAITKFWVDDDGIWSPVNTVNPRVGTAAIIFPTPQVKFPASLTGTSFCTTQPAVITWTSRGVAKVDLQISPDGTNFTTFASGITASLGTYSWNIPEVLAGGNNLRLRILDTDRPTTVLDVTGFVNVNAPAVITVEPIGQDACLGGSVTLAVQANGTSLKFQWEKDGNILLGQNGPILVISSITQGSSGLYRCIIGAGSGCPGTTSKYALISVLPTLAFSTQPGVVAVANGSTATLAVETSIQSGVSYQWFRGTAPMNDNGRITGTRSPSLTIRNIGNSDFGNDYVCVATSVCGTAKSAFGTLASANIVIAQNPASQSLCEGADADFSCLASSTLGGTLNYQWMKDGVAISDGSKYSGTTTTFLTVKAIVKSDTGKYSCKVTSSIGAQSFTQNAVLSLKSIARVVAQTADTSLCAGSPLVLQVSASDTSAVTYEWFLDVNSVYKGLNRNYTVPAGNAQLLAQYKCVVYSECGSDTSRTIKVSRLPLTLITTQPRKTVKLLEGGTILLSIEATGSRLKFQWFRNGRKLDGDTTASLTILNAKTSDAGEYTCTVSGDCGNVTSEISAVDITSDVQELETFGFSLEQSSPNPTSSTTVISYELASTKFISLSICDFLGRPIATLLEGIQEPGMYAFNYNASELTQGTYWLILRSGEAVITRRLAVIR